MYLYIYDEQAGKKKFLKTLTNIEKKLTDLGLNGKILRLKEIKNPIPSVQKELNKGCKTVVVVGDDKTIHQTVNALAASHINNSKLKPALGVIPLEEKNSTVASALGIKDPLEACDIILARRNIRINLGKINDSYFLSEITINNPEKQLEINKNYSINVTQPGKIFAVNFSHYVQGNPFDNLLDLYIFTRSKGFSSLFSSQKNDTSYFPLKNLDIHHKKATAKVDNAYHLKTPINISVARQKINVIVGKNRNF
jgi:diacylglycerol kinase family enzyme